MRLTRPFVTLDAETTGTSTDTDRIIELAAIRLQPDGHKRMKVWKLNPGIPISPGATEVHGFTDEDVADLPSFRDKAVEILAFVQGADLCGYNARKFDVPLLVVEFGRVGVQWEPGLIVDVLEIYRRFRPNTLVQATRDYLGRELEGAHGALADTEATWEVLQAQMVEHELPTTVEELADCTREPGWLDRDGKFRLVDGEAVCSFGKHAGATLRNLCMRERSYLRWMLKKDFGAEVDRLLEEALAGRFPGEKAEPEQGELTYKAGVGK